MPLHHFSIFSKNTDANATIKGYEFQKLRTLEIWLESYLAKADEVTYCEYEDDVFSRDSTSWISRFRQIKLYSSKNFSFKSEEVTKAIFNFFMLFIKGEFKFDDVQFWFETNAGIAARNGDNGSDLLKEWHQEQGKVSASLLTRCADRIKKIVTEIIAEGKLADESAARDLIADLPVSVWEDFTQRIQWQFEEIDPETALNNSMTRIRELIAKTGFPIALQQPRPAFYCLIFEVSKRSMADDPEDRKLDSALMDKLLLTTIDQLETGYAEDWEYWQENLKIYHFRAAEFYPLIAAANYCHHNSHLRHHLNFWQSLLQQYILLKETPAYYRRKAINELAWCAAKKITNKHPNGSLIGESSYIQLYFFTLGRYDDYESLYEAIHLLALVSLHIQRGTCMLELANTLRWQQQIKSMITERISSAERPEQTCYYNELAALLIKLDMTNSLSHDKIGDAIRFYNVILQVIKDAPQYNVIALAEEIDQWLNQLMKDDTGLEDIERLQEVYDRLLPFVNSREREESNARRAIDQGTRYLESTDRNCVLKALAYYHKARGFYRQDKTKKGYVLTLMNLAQLYNVAGCDLAAKYYALSAAWQCSQYDKLHDLMSDAMGLVFHMDHAQGAWLSALEGFRMYIRSREEFGDTKDYDMFDKNLQEFAFVISAGPRILPESTRIVEPLKKEMGQLYDWYLSKYVAEDDEISLEKISDVIQARLHDRPFNDAGPVRTIEWHAAGLSWKINFENTWLMNSIGEEFCAVLQILLLELVLSKQDLHLLQLPVELDLEIGKGHKDPIRKPANSARWTVFLPNVQKEDYQQIERQTPLIVANIAMILKELSLLPDKELTDLITRHFDNENLAGKTLPDFLYQRLYRNLFTRSSFDKLKRNTLTKAGSNFKHKTFSALRWEVTDSPRYDREKALSRIRERYQGFTSTTHLTIKRLQRDPGYADFIAALRSKGWLDWQILMAIANHLISYKVNALLLKRRFPSDAERVAAYHREAFRLHSLPEEQTYTPVSLSYFQSTRFDNQLNNVAKLILDDFKLDYRVEYPVFEALNEFVRRRLHFGEDDLPELSPL